MASLTDLIVTVAGIALIILCADSASDFPDRNSKMFPYFLVQFPNEPCTNQNGSQHGTCISMKECREGDGLSLGVCAKGFGVCCKRSVTCGSEDGDLYVRENATELRGGNGSATCRYVLPKRRGVCQIRLDFVEFRYGKPNPFGDCGSARVEVGGGSSLTKHENLCGDLSGQHLYLNYGDSGKIYIHSKGPSQPSDVYSILVNFIQCGSSQTVPAYCDQFYSEVHGKIMSFNWPRQQLNNQFYTVCVADSRVSLNRKRSVNSQTISWSKCDLNSRESFFLSGNLNSTVDYSQLENCEGSDYVQIFGGSKQCGKTFRNQTVSFKPFLLRVNFDGSEGVGSSDDSEGIVVGKPPQGCVSLQTPETQCENESFGLCRCWKVTKGRLNSKQKESNIQNDTGNTGFCLMYEIN